MDICQFDEPLIATNQKPNPLIVKHESSTSTRKDFQYQNNTSSTTLSFELETSGIREDPIPTTASFDYKEFTSNLEPIITSMYNINAILKPLLQIQCALEPLIEIQRSLRPMLEMQRQLEPLIEINSFLEPLIRIQTSIENLIKLSHLGIDETNDSQENEVLEKTSKINLEPMIKDQQDFKNFYDCEKWIEDQRKNYPKELIAYIKKNGEFVLIAHSKIEKELLKQIDMLFEKNVIDQEDIIYFDS